MAIFLHCTGDVRQAWSRDLAQATGAEILSLSPDGSLERGAEVAFAATWKPPPGVWRQMPHLRGIACLGAGVDALLADVELPPLPIARLVDPAMSARMAEYVVGSVLGFTRSIEDYARLQAERIWRPLPSIAAADFPVGLLGLGEMGRACALGLGALGFPVRGWSQSGRPVDGVEVFSGDSGRFAMAARCRALVCLLPLTPKTRGIVDKDLLERLLPGALFVNAARGGHVRDEDLISALENGRVTRAVLDVFETEPLPPEHPYWGHPQVRLTPHISAPTHRPTAVVKIAENYRRCMAGEKMLDLVDRSRGY